MRRLDSKIMRLVVAGAFALLAGGCAAAAAGVAAGAGATLYMTDRGASTSVAADLTKASAWTKQAFDDEGIQVTGTNTESDEVDISGTKGDMNVKAQLHRDGADTKIDVVAQKNPVQWDKDLAKRVVQKIMAQAS